MKEARPISTGPNYSAADIGSFAEVSRYKMIHPRTGKELTKLFLKNITGATGTEISFNSLAPHSELPYFHAHRKNEETWIILKGEGLFQVDSDSFPVKEGSVIRVAPAGVRGISNTGDGEMIYCVIQSRAGSLEDHSSADGFVVEPEKKF